jgi:cysteine-rich repeat protein
VLFGLECDDGNLIDGDGCSSNCTIEKDYSCINGSSTSPSVCSYNGSVSLTLQTGDKDPNSNTMTLKYELIGSAALLQLNGGSLDFNSLVSFPASEGVTVLEAYIDPTTNSLVVKIAYTKTLQDTDLMLQLTPPNVPQAFALSNMTNIWNVRPTNQLAARLYSKKDYQDQERAAIVANLVLAAFLSVMLLTIAYRKFIGLELATLIQFGYLSLLQNREITVYAEPIAAWKYVFGYNELYYSSLPAQRFLFPYALYGYQPRFGFSNNFMVVAAYAVYALAFLLLLLSGLAKKGTAHRIRYTSFFMATDIAYTLVVFLSPSILTAFCIEVKEGIVFDWSMEWSNAFMVAALLMFGVAHCVSLATATDSTDVDTFVVKTKAGIYMPIAFNVRLTVLSILLFFYHLSEYVPTVSIFFLQSFYLLFVLLCRPHLLLYDLCRSLFIELGLLCILVLRQVEIRVMTGSLNPLSSWFPFVAYLEYAIYIIAIILSVISLVLNCCQHKPDKIHKV